MNEIIQFLSTYASSAGITGGIVYAGKKLYPDLLQPTVQAMGQSLSHCWNIVLGNRIAMLDERSKATLGKNMATVADMVKDADPEKILKDVPPELGVPLLEKLSYVEAKDVAQLYAELLAKSLYKDTLPSVHPRFISIIDNFAVDEATIIAQLYNYMEFLDPYQYTIPFIRLMRYGQKSNSYIFESGRLTDIRFRVPELSFPDREQSYLDNFVSLGLLSCHENEVKSDFTDYDKLISRYEGLIQELNEQQQDRLQKISIQRGIYRLTHLGVEFIKVCCYPIPKAS